MRVLVVGSGGREHALAWKISRSSEVERVFAAPGSDGMAAVAHCEPGVAAEDTAGLIALVRREALDLVVVGPEGPLADGVTDRLREAGVAVFGPTQQAARLEASKSFARDFMARHGVPQPAFRRFEGQQAARDYVRELGGPCVVKADGLCAGKGVSVCDGVSDAEAALQEIMGDRRFGTAGAAVLVEERLEGEEASYYAITDGEQVVTLAAAQDHKRALDGDRGENTGGMGAYVPAAVVSEATEKRILEEVIHPTLRGLRQEGSPYQGVLYAGLMIDPGGAPRVIEFNVRFGDPETQPLLLGMDGDLAPILDAAARGRLDPEARLGLRGASVCVVLASGGYPRSYETGKAIEGLAEVEAQAEAQGEEVVVFHAGTRRAPEGGFVTAGGRVLGVTARGADVAEARQRAYAAAEGIRFEGRQMRRDIAARGV